MVYKMYRVYIGSSKQNMVYKMYRVYIGSSKQRKILRTGFGNKLAIVLRELGDLGIISKTFLK